MPFIDEVEIRVVSGRGGDGCCSFRREKYVAFGGPDGGDGGRGGSVHLVADQGLNTLARFRGQRLYKAERGHHGSGKQRTGRCGKGLELRVPLGTMVRDVSSGDLLADLAEHGDSVLVARGGRGGRGNMRFISATNRAPRQREEGGQNEERSLLLELRLLADVGVVGFPNAGKSTFVSRISAARPRIADYPFTTLVPNLGVVERGHEGSWVVADVPGLIEGAAHGAGLGHRFLRHVQRTRLLVHLVRAIQEESGSPAQRHAKLRAELDAYDPRLATRREIVVLSQVDAATAEQIQDYVRALHAAGVGQVHVVSAVTGRGLSELLDAIWVALQQDPT